MVLNHSTKDHQERTVLSLLPHALFSPCSFLCTSGRSLFRCFPGETAGVPTVVRPEVRLSTGPLRTMGLRDVIPVITVIVKIVVTGERYGLYVNLWG